MGKASSSKKVARAARVGSTHKGPERRELGFPLAIGVTLLIGVSLVLFARSNRSTAVEPMLNKTHWHAAYGIYNCDKWEDPLKDKTDAAGNDLDPNGIHTHGDGVIHIHPFNSSSAGNNAKMKVFFDTVGVKASNDKIQLPNGDVLQNGAQCNGKAAVLKVARWNVDDLTAAPVVVTSNFNNIRLGLQDRQAFTIALIPDGVDIPKPTSIPTLDQLSDVPGAATTTVPGQTTTTVPGQTTTTVAGAAPTTTAAGAAPTTTTGR